MASGVAVASVAGLAIVTAVGGLTFVAYVAVMTIVSAVEGLTFVAYVVIVAPLSFLAAEAIMAVCGCCYFSTTTDV